DVPVNNNSYYPDDAALFDYGFGLNYESVGLPENDSKPLATAYPNPVNDVLTVNPQSNHNVTISLYDVEGRELYQSVSSSGEGVEIRMREFSQGVYFLKMDNGVSVQTKKIIRK
ncbi:MAG: T9SS type A sorting domain-containing protein, partial [Bacteroidota bacterium]